jgi:hypothetical protein
LKILLRVVDLRILREGASERSLTYRYDADLSWAPIPDSSSIVTNARTIHVQHNRLGFRDIEFQRDARPTMLFIGDSFVWGVDAEADERFTDLLRSRISNFGIVNAGVSSHGARIQTSHSSGVVRITGMAFGWIGSATAFRLNAGLGRPASEDFECCPW